MCYVFFLHCNLLVVCQTRGPKRGCDRGGFLAKTTSNRQSFLRVDWHQMDETSNLCLSGQAKAALCLVNQLTGELQKHRHYYCLITGHHPRSLYQPGSPMVQMSVCCVCIIPNFALHNVCLNTLCKVKFHISDTPAVAQKISGHFCELTLVTTNLRAKHQKSTRCFTIQNKILHFLKDIDNQYSQNGTIFTLKLVEKKFIMASSHC